MVPAEGDAFTPEVAKGDGYSIEIADFAARVKGEDRPEVSTLEGSLDAIRISKAIEDSARTGEKVKLA